MSVGMCLGALIWTSPWKPAEVEVMEQLPVIVVEAVQGEEPAPDETVDSRIEPIVEAPPPAPRQVAVLATPPAEIRLPTTDAEVFDGEPVQPAVAWDEMVNQFPKAEPKKPKPVARKPSPARKSRVAMKLTPVRKAATLLRRVQPVYPVQARRAGVEGSVLLNVAVGIDGRVGGVSVASSSGNGLLDSAAMRAVRKWSFRPATLNGKPVQSNLRVPVRFQLR